MEAMEANSRPRTKPAHERRDDLMNAAPALFLEGGIGLTTIEQITARAGVAKGSFYLQYSSKEDIHAALGERFIERYVGNLDAALGENGQVDADKLVSTLQGLCFRLLGLAT